MKVDDLENMVLGKAPYPGREETSIIFSPIELLHSSNTEVMVTGMDREKHQVYIPAIDRWVNVNEFELPEPEPIVNSGKESIGEQILERATNKKPHPQRRYATMFDPIQIRIKGEKQMRFIHAIDQDPKNEESVRLSNGSWIYTKRIELPEPETSSTPEEPPPAA